MMEKGRGRHGSGGAYGKAVFQIYTLLFRSTHPLNERFFFVKFVQICAKYPL